MGQLSLPKPPVGSAPQSNSSCRIGGGEKNFPDSCGSQKGRGGASARTDSNSFRSRLCSERDIFRLATNRPSWDDNSSTSRVSRGPDGTEGASLADFYGGSFSTNMKMKNEDEE